jgi:hypothetical protein
VDKFPSLKIPLRELVHVTLQLIANRLFFEIVISSLRSRYEMHFSRDPEASGLV